MALNQKHFYFFFLLQFDDDAISWNRLKAQTFLSRVTFPFGLIVGGDSGKAPIAASLSSLSLSLSLRSVVVTISMSHLHFETRTFSNTYQSIEINKQNKNMKTLQ